MQLAFKIPPCDDSVCCNDCSSFIKHNEQISSKTGKLQYFNKVNYVNNSITLPDGSHAVINTERPEAWQFYDPSIARELAPINITSPYDISISSPYFPTSVSINKNTSLRDVPYTVD